MANPLTRGTAPFRAQPAAARPGSFKPGHQKLGGRKRGTPNLLAAFVRAVASYQMTVADYQSAFYEAAFRIGCDGNGKGGVAGYFRWVSERDPHVYLSLVLKITTLGASTPSYVQEMPEMTEEELEPTREEFDAAYRAYIDRDVPAKKHLPPVAWTGQPAPVGNLMVLAVEDPKEFCRLLFAVCIWPLHHPRKPSRAAILRVAEKNQPGLRYRINSTKNRKTPSLRTTF
jgi:hypothetical protein